MTTWVLTFTRGNERTERSFVGDDMTTDREIVAAVEVMESAGWELVWEEELP